MTFFKRWCWLPSGNVLGSAEEEYGVQLGDGCQGPGEN